TGTRPLGSPPQPGQTGPRGQVVQPAPMQGRPGERAPYQPHGGQAARPAAPQQAPTPTPPPPPPVEVVVDEQTNRRVVRNESGVIVGAASQRAEPKILGFIQLANRPRPQQVIITDANEEQARGRATIR